MANRLINTLLSFRYTRSRNDLEHSKGSLKTSDNYCISEIVKPRTAVRGYLLICKMPLTLTQS